MTLTILLQVVFSVPTWQILNALERQVVLLNLKEIHFSIYIEYASESKRNIHTISKKHTSHFRRNTLTILKKYSWMEFSGLPGSHLQWSCNRPWKTWQQVIHNLQFTMENRWYTQQKFKGTVPQFFSWIISWIFFTQGVCLDPAQGKGGLGGQLKIGF